MAAAQGDIQLTWINDDGSAATGFVVDVGSDGGNVSDDRIVVGLVHNGGIAAAIDDVLGGDKDDDGGCDGGNIGDGIAASAGVVVGGDDGGGSDGGNIGDGIAASAGVVVGGDNEAAAHGGHGRRRLHEQALEVLLGENNLDTIGLFIGLVGLATMSSGIGGFFTRGAPAIFVVKDDDQQVVNDGMSTYYKCLPFIIVLGLAEMLYAIWVSRNAVRSSIRIAKLVLFLSIPPLVLSWSFTGSLI